MGFFDKIKQKIFNNGDKDSYLQGFNSNKDDLGSKLKNIKSVYRKLDDDFLEELMIVLLEADVGIVTAEKIITRLKAKSKEYVAFDFDDIMDFLVEVMYDLYNEVKYDDQIIYNENGTTVILLVGVNGAGKTTTIAKLCEYFKNEGKSVALVAGDTFRAGATEQLANWADRLNVPIVKGEFNQDSSSVLVDGCRFAKENNIDILLCDTAGRLQNKVNLMHELAKMHKVIEREIENAPHNCWLVIDSTTGQNGISQAENFNDTTKLTGIVLTKMDGTSKGGIVLAIKDIISVPVMFLGLGEKPQDLKKFDLNLYLYSLISGAKDESNR